MIVKQIESLEQIDILKDQFVSLASHQIRSPLTAIRWLSESLLESKPHKNSPKQRTALNKIHTTTLRLITLTSQLLNISRLEAGSLVPHFKQLTLKELVSPVVSEVKTGRTHSNPLKIKWNTSQKSYINTDPLLVREILLVLIGNALKYSDRNNQIDLAITRHSNHFEIRVKNQGIGIPKSVKDHIFTRFYRADNARLHHPDGNGLGLYLAKLITTKLGGDLTYVSTSGTTIFTLDLPNEVS